MATYVGLQDLVKRWIYTRQGVHKLTRARDFPAPAFSVNAGHTKVWHVADVQTFESAHPELTSEAAKRRKVRGYGIAAMRRRKG